MLILHLSDIHFRKSEISTVQDPNLHLRNEIIRDAAEQCSELGPPDVIVISGDIAFAGDPEEFVYATRWLERLCVACGCPMSSVFVVPGNHDVVRSVAEQNMVQMIHRTIKESANPTAEIFRQLNDPLAQRLLYEGLENYNEFASQFLCDLLPPERTSAKRDLTLNDGSTLRLWGLNSAFVSSGHDKERDLFVDQASFQIMREDGVVNLVVTHHHLSWLRQARELEDHLNDVAPIQIFGHVHMNRINLDRDYVRLTASAANPDRHEKGWEPGYNLIQLSVDGGGQERTIQVKAHVRVWQTAPSGFHAKMDRNRSPFFEQRINLENWTPPKTTSFTSPTHVEIAQSHKMPIDDSAVMGTVRNLALRFYKLSFSKKSEIVGRLDLLEDEDMHSPDFERFRRVFIRANERGLLNALDNAITEVEQR